MALSIPAAPQAPTSSGSFIFIILIVAVIAIYFLFVRSRIKAHSVTQSMPAMYGLRAKIAVLPLHIKEGILAIGVVGIILVVLVAQNVFNSNGAKELNTSSQNADITGKWVDINNDQNYIFFFDDGTSTLKSGDLTFSGTYKIVDTQLILTTALVSVIYDFRINVNILTLTEDNGKTTILTKKTAWNKNKSKVRGKMTCIKKQIK